MMLVFRLVGALGLVLISLGVINRKRKYQDVLYLFGGISLAVYSIYLKDPIFIPLQLIFTGVAAYDLCRQRWKK